LEKGNRWKAFATFFAKKVAFQYRVQRRSCMMYAHRPQKSCTVFSLWTDGTIYLPALMVKQRKQLTPSDGLEAALSITILNTRNPLDRVMS
jgi:hypothetical protein